MFCPADFELPHKPNLYVCKGFCNRIESSVFQTDQEWDDLVLVANLFLLVLVCRCQRDECT